MSDIVLKIGADPEFFLYKDGKPVSAYGLIDGTKKNPVPVKNGAIQVDGMALEFNIDPATTMQGFNDNIVSVIDQFRDIIPKEYEFSFTPVAEFGEQYIAEQPEEARRLGCDPDYNAWQGGVNPIPNAKGSFRTASGHIHIGWTENQDINDPEHIEACQMMVKQLDMILGMASVVWDPDNRRRELYGKAGAYRPKSYGVEYRVMSNTWVNIPWMRNYVFDAAKFSFDQLMNGKKYYSDVGTYSEAYQKYINLGQFHSAFNMVERSYYDSTGGLSPVYNERIKIEERKKAAELEAKMAKVKNTPNIAGFNEAVAQAQMKRRRPRKPPLAQVLDVEAIQPVPPAPPVERVNQDIWEWVAQVQPNVRAGGGGLRLGEFDIAVPARRRQARVVDEGF